MDLAPKIHEICLQMSETFLAVIELQTLMDSASLAATIKEADRYAIVLPLPAFPCTTTVNLLAAVFASWWQMPVRLSPRCCQAQGTTLASQLVVLLQSNADMGPHAGGPCGAPSLPSKTTSM